MTKTILLTLTYLVGAGELILAVYFWATNSKSEIRRVMALMAFFTGIWVVSSGLTAYIGQNTVTTVYMQIVFVSALFMITALLHVTLIYPTHYLIKDRIHGWLLYVPAMLFSWIMLSSNTIVTGFTGSAIDSGRVIPGPLYSEYNMYIFGLYLLTIILLFVRQRNADGDHKKNILLILYAVGIGAIPAVLIDLIIPVITASIFPNALYGAISTVVWLGAITYILRRR